MLANKYYVIYVEVPTGYPGVVTVYAKDREHLQKMINNPGVCGFEYAVIGIMEGK